MLINVKMPTIVGILTFMSTINFVLSRVEHGKSFIISGPGFVIIICVVYSFAIILLRKRQLVALPCILALHACGFVCVQMPPPHGSVGRSVIYLWYSVLAILICSFGLKLVF